MKTKQIYSTVLTIALLLSTTLIASAQNVVGYISITGTKQGDIKGTSMVKGTEGKIECIGFNYTVVSPHDVATGQLSGKRQQHPVEITKYLDNTSPQLLQAAYTNEVLKTVTIEFYKKNNIGQMTAYYTIKLTNATITQITQSAGDEAARSNEMPTEHISFTFQKIETTNVESKTTAADNWMVN